MTDDLIERLGGVTRVSELLGVSFHMVAAWRKRGAVAWEYRPAMIELAERLGAEVPDGFRPPRPLEPPLNLGA